MAGSTRAHHPPTADGERSGAAGLQLDHPELLRTAGQPRPGVQVRMVATAREPLSDAAPGVIEVRLPGMSSGYIGRPSDPAFRNGWYTTGDLGLVDDGGYLHVLGRAADAREVGGTTVLPLDLEDAACAHRDVVYAALPDDQHAFGVVALRVYGSSLAAEELREHLRRNVVPAAVGPVVVVDHLPVTEQGKPNRTILTELLRP